MKTERGEGEESKTRSKGVTITIVVKEKGRFPVDSTGLEVLGIFFVII